MAIFPNLEGVDEIPELHYKYAEFVLNYIIKGLTALDDIEIGIIDEGSMMSFYGETDDLELSLIFRDYEFTVRVLEHGESFNCGQFYYNLTSNEMEENIPETIRSAMRGAASDREPITFKLGGTQLQAPDTDLF